MKNILIIALFVLPIFLTAQNSKWTVRADFYNPKPVVAIRAEGLENAYHKPMNYGFALGAERNWKQNERFRCYQTIMAGFYRDYYFEKALTLETATGVDFRLFKGLHAGLELSAAVNRATETAVLYKYVDNKWEPTQEGINKITRRNFSLAGQLGYRITPKLDVFAGFGINVLNPLFDTFLLFPYKSAKLGVRWRL
jgi:opacity protein-like surface antigen